MKSDEEFDTFWNQLVIMAYENDIPQIPQTRTRSESNPDSNSKEYYKNIYFQGVDKLIECIHDRLRI